MSCKGLFKFHYSLWVFALFIMASGCGKNSGNGVSSEESRSCGSGPSLSGFHVVCVREVVLPNALKSCMDQKLNAVIDEEVREHPESNGLEAAGKAFDRVTQECGLSTIQKEMYLYYTNVPAGVFPDSVEGTQIQKGVGVLHLSSLRTGTAVDVFQDLFTVRWDRGSNEETITKSEFTREVKRRAGFLKNKKIVRISGLNLGRVTRVFANSAVEVDWDQYGKGSEIIASKGLAIEVACYARVCTGVKLVSKSSRRKGVATAVFSSGQVEVKWDQYGEGSTVEQVSDFEVSEK